MSGMSGLALAGYGMNYFPLSASTEKEEDIVLIAGSEGRRIVVLGYALNIDIAQTVAFKDSAGEVLAEFDLAAHEGYSYSGGPGCPALDLEPGRGLALRIAPFSKARGHLTYVLTE